MITFLSSAAVTFDAKTRTLSGLAVPYEVTAPNGYRFHTGTLTLADSPTVKLTVNHDTGRIVGVLQSWQETPDGLAVVFTLPEDPDTDAAIGKVRAGFYDSLSIGVDILDATESDGVIDVTAGRVREVALTGTPAFDTAAITDLAASWRANNQTTEATTMAVPQTVAASAPAPDPVTFTADQAPSTPESVPFTPRITTGREESPYVFGSQGRGSFLRDLYAVQFGMASQEQRDRQARFASMNRAMVTFAAGDPLARPGTAGQLWQNGYRPDLLVGELDLGRPICSAFNRTAIDNVNPFMIPTFSQTDGVVGAHSAGSGATDAAVITVGSVTVTPVAYSGLIDVNRELIDAGSPAVDTLILDSIGLHYRNIVEGIAKTALETAGNATADATAPTTGALAVQTLVAQQATIVGTYGARADAHLVASDVYSQVVKAVDSTGRPLIPFNSATNAVGTVQEGGTGLSINGVPVILSTQMTAKKLQTVKRDSFLIAESPMLTFRFDQVLGPGQIRLAAFGYFVAASTRKAGNIQATAGTWTT